MPLNLFGLLFSHTILDDVVDRTNRLGILNDYLKTEAPYILRKSKVVSYQNVFLCLGMSYGSPLV